jgi:hypothetical protein
MNSKGKYSLTKRKGMIVVKELPHQLNPGERDPSSIREVGSSLYQKKLTREVQDLRQIKVSTV